MRERFKGTGSLKSFADSTGNGLTKREKDILDLWNIEEMDEYDREDLFQKYSITNKDLDIYYNKSSSNSETGKYTLNSEIQTKEMLVNLSEPETDIEEQDNNLKGSIAAAGAERRASGIRSFTQKSGKVPFISSVSGSNFGTGELSSKGLTAAESEHIQYHVKNMDVLMNGEKMDPKDVTFDLQKEAGQHDILKMSF